MESNKKTLKGTKPISSIEPTGGLKANPNGATARATLADTMRQVRLKN
jgi:hypothetical protein